MPKARITLTSLHQLLQDHTARFESSDRRQERIIAQLVLVKEQLNEHSGILKPLQERVELLYGAVDNFEVRTDRFEQEYLMITAALRRLEDRFDPREAEKLRTRIASLETRVRALESNKRQ